MMRRKNTSNKSLYIQLVITCLLLLTPLYTFALGVKGIEVMSALNQPLDAKVGVNLAKGQKIYDIKAKLASAKAHSQAGIEIPYFLTRLKFEPKADKDGNSFIHITSKEVVREPYLNFLLEVNSQGGNFIKEFTVLLDPVFLNKPTSKQNSSPVEQNSKEDKSPNETLYGPVQAEETLWDIAKKNKPSESISVNQMINSIYLTNPNAFIRGDINLLKRGVTLKIPRINQTEAVTDKAESTPASKPKQEQIKSTIIPVEATSTSEAEPKSKVQSSAPPKEINPAEAAETKTTSKTDLDKDSTPSSTAPDKQPADEKPDKLEVAAVPESQLDEIEQEQGEGEKVYPANDIERLRSSIADRSSDIVALKAINSDLLKLQDALKKKIAVVRKELEDTNKTISKISKDMEASKIAISEKSTPAPTDIPKEEEASNNVETKPATTAVSVATNTPEAKSKKKGINISADTMALEKVKKLESEIAELKAQHETVQIQKYIIILLLLALLGAAILVVLNKNGHLQKFDRNPLTMFFEWMSNLIKWPSRSDRQTSEFLDLIDTEVIPDNLERPDIPEYSTDEDTKQDDYYTELLEKLTNQDQGLSALGTSDNNKDEAADNNTTVPEPASNSDEHNIDRTLTSVNVYIAYRRFSEAEFALQKAIQEMPDHPSLKGKLLEIYAMKNDAKELSQHLDEYHHQLSTQAPELWYSVLHKCARLIPNDPVIQKYIDEAHSIPDSESSLDSSEELFMDTENIIDEIDLADVDLFDEEADQTDMELFFQKPESDEGK